jgi:hypothetical protein
MKRVEVVVHLLVFYQVFTSHWSLAYAQATNGSTTVMQETMAAGGGKVGGGNPMSAITVLGEPLGGMAGNGTFSLRVASPTPAAAPGGTRSIAVEGTIDDSAAAVTVNGVAATITAGTFRAEGVLLVEGLNVITATATDAAGNQSSRSISVTLDTVPPARPTVGATPPVTTATTHTLTGTKTPGTSIHLNGVEAVPLNDSTTWTVTANLQEGDNALVITAKDAIGHTSASNTVTIIVDALPPVIAATAPAKTNLTPLVLSGTVDDSLTAVTVNGSSASRAGKTFTTSVSLIEGPNTLTITATSPNGFVSTSTLEVVLGTIPTIASTQPADAAKLYAGSATTLAATATDKESDPVELQILLDGAVVAGWAAGAAYPWTPGTSALGLHTVEIRARDGFGGVASRQAQVYVLRRPVPPP